MDSKNKAKNYQVLDELRERAMKVTEALYRTTDLFSDAEPLKWSLRDSAVKILNTISDISNQPTYQELRSVHMLEKIIKSLCCKLDLAVGGTFIARSNFDVLEREYKLISEKISNTDFFNTNVLDIPDKRTLLVQKSPINSIMSDTKKQTIEITQNYGSPTSIVAMEVGLPTKDLSDRKGAILKHIKERGPSSVGDMRKLIDMSLSEKTIQRDLNALAETGILKREGEKRWRKYFV